MAFEISNLYEQLVTEQITTRYTAADGLDQEVLEDIACVALNHLPARYYHHRVDLVYYLDGEERDKMARQVDAAVGAAHQFVMEHRSR
jgi:hypothetical protein